MKNQAALKIGLILFLGFLIPKTVFSESVRMTPVVKVVQQTSPSVVNIGTERTVLIRQHPFYGSALDDFLRESQQGIVGTLKTQSLGSGVIVSKDGLIVTNAHVIQMANKIFVNLPGGDAREAQLLGTNAGDDLALLKIDIAEDLPFISPSEDVILGETVVSIGNPLGLQSSVSSGIVSGLNRSLTVGKHVFSNLIQTDASINPGSSGGALVNLDGKLAGINLAVIQNAQNIGFAIPAQKIKTLLAEYDKIKAAQSEKKIPVT